MQKPTHPTTKSVKQVYNQIAQEFDQTRQKPWPEFEDFKKWIPQKGSVLDVGCGNGRLSEWLGEDIEYLGVDQSEAFIQIAQKNHPNRKFEVAEMSQLDLKKEFDAIISIAAFHHLPDKENRKETLKRFHSHLKPEGVLIMTVWNLWQKKYSKEWWTAVWSWVRHGGKKGRWNDLWIKWKTKDQLRYYHAFSQRELKGLLDPNVWTIESIYKSRFNYNVVARKK